jgi:hypothetical protein
MVLFASDGKDNPTSNGGCIFYIISCVAIKELMSVFWDIASCSLVEVE